MRKYGDTLLNIIILSVVLVGTAMWLRVFYASLLAYRSPLHAVQLPVQPEPPGQTRSVVIVLVDGLGEETFEGIEFPVLDRLRETGARFILTSPPPTYDQTTWATLITGAGPELNDAPPVDLPTGAVRPLAVDTLFHRAADFGLTPVLVGPPVWQTLLPADPRFRVYPARQSGPTGDRETLETALALLEEDPPALMVVHFTRLGQLAAGSGPNSDSYRQAALTLDSYIGRLAASLDLSRSVLLFTSSHGYTPEGGTGGADPAVSRTPLVAVGQGIIPGEYSPAPQTDLAPTVSLLLGIPFPTATQGRPLTEMIRLSERDRAVTQINLARQRVALVQEYLRLIEASPMPEQVVQDLEQAHQAFRARNISGAMELARLTRQEADNLFAAARHQRLEAERRPRLVLVILLVTAWLALMWRRRNAFSGLVVIAAAGVIVVFHSLYQLQGYEYTLSTTANHTAWAIDVARFTAAGMLAGGGILLFFLLFTEEENWLVLLNAGYSFALLTVFALAVPLAWAFWQNGWAVHWSLPDAGTTFWQFLAVFQTLTAVMFGLLLPWPVMALSRLAGFIRRLTGRNRTEPEDVLPLEL
ncbi:MAG: hypothetical protein D6784_00170 [Chloroflexi bacterium]|nr:MAG: hypothetical protein D6784_00170 [Chloroflexota bacterium]